MNVSEQRMSLTTALPSRSVKDGLLQRKCVCGQHKSGTGDCANCHKKKLNKPLHAKMQIGDTNDSYEREADYVAEQVMRMPESNNEDANEYLQANSLVQRQASNTQSGTAEVPYIVHDVLHSPGQPLDQTTREFMEPRFDHDFSQVRIHTNTKAAESALAVNAAAYTVGENVIFSKGAYSPNTTMGRELLAHELTHYIQQQTSIPKIQRRLTVNRNHPSFAPSTDPAASLTPAQRLSMMDSVIQALCDEYEVDSTNGEVLTKSRTSLDRTELVTGSKPTGCCCLSILTDSATSWSIEISQVIGPHMSGNQVVLSPTSTPIEFGSFTSTNTLAFPGAVPAAGHELCGHAALIEIAAHPPSQSRTTTDIHDPTVNIENIISTEQGVPAADLRGLARSGTHRGESVDRVSIRDYSFNQTSIPASQNGKINFTADYINENRSFVDILGHSDSVGSASAKQNTSTSRAQNVKARLIQQGVPATISKFSLTNVNRFTRVEGLSDTQPPPPPLLSNQDNWRRTEILISGFPAGAQNPPAGTPTTVTPHTRSPSLGAARSSTDECVRLLARGAYP